ncbi:MAG: flagellar biosynthesis protein FlhB [Bacillota bacterium]
MILFKIDLQRFSGEKTEKATSKKRSDARKKGQVLQSKEINSAFILFITFLTVWFMGSYMYKNISYFTINLFSDIPDYENLSSINSILSLSMQMLQITAKLVLPILGVAFLAALITGYAQVGFLFTTETLTFKLEKLNPINGFKRMFSVRSLVELVKSFIKIGVVGYVAFSYIIKNSKNIMNIFDMDLEKIAVFLFKMTFQIMFRAAIVLLVLAVLDYYYQKWQYEKDLRMSKQEVKEEYKQMEGDPQVKSKIKEKQRQISMRRMMQDVPKADVIITNPTHYAVAVRYDNSIDHAPIILAKGKDLIAQNIKKVANEHEVPIVENKPLARAIYYTVEIGEYLPPELYQAVAEVLAYVYRLKNII